MDESSNIASTATEVNKTADDDDTNIVLNDNRTDTMPHTSQTATEETGSNFVTVEEIAESLRQKEKEHDSLSNGSNLSGSNGSISQLSSNLRTDQFDSSLNALKEKKNKLINSLRNAFADSSATNIDEDRLNSSTMSLVSDSGNPECRPNIETSTPFPESKPLAARFLKNWKPSFITDDLCEIDEIDTSDDESGYEKAMASLKEVLSDSSVDTASKLDSYSNMLDAFKEEDDKKYDEMISTITLENNNLEECLENATKEVDEFIEKCSEKTTVLELSSTLDDTVIQIDSKDCTLVAREEPTAVPKGPESDTETNIKNVSKIPIVVTIDSSQSDNDDITVIYEKTITSKIPVEPVKSEIPTNQKTSDVSKENDLEILIIEGDEDIDINADDEDLLLASDDEVKQDKSENKKGSPQVPLVKDLEVFVSNDPDENRDNNDPKWDYLRNIGTNYDRYLAVRARWNNIQIPNPKKDLTCRCRNPNKKINGYSAFNYNNNHINGNRINNEASKKRLHSPETQYRFAKRPRRDTCTILFDRNIDQLAEDVRNERQNIINEQEQALQQLADIQHMEKYVTRRKGGTMMDMKRLADKHQLDTRKCVNDFRRRMDEMQEMARAKHTALKKASEEVKQFHEFYPNEDEKNGDTKSLLYLTDMEVQEILEVEEMLLSFPAFYND